MIEQQTLHFWMSHQVGIDLRTNTYTSAAPSGRLRVLLPAQDLMANGYQVRVTSLHRDGWNPRVEISDAEDLHIVSKVYGGDSVRRVLSLVDKGRRVIFDYCDNYFTGGEFHSEHMQLLDATEVASVNTCEMARTIRRLGRARKIHIVGDPVEGPMLPPKSINVDQSLRMIAFGNRLVCKHLEAWLEPLIKLRQEVPLHIEVVTQVDREILRWFEYWRESKSCGDFLTFTMWNEFQMPHAFARNSICLIPSQDDPYNFTKSTNRLVEATAAGLFTLCWPLPAYQTFQDHFCVTRDIAKGVETLLSIDSPQRNIRNGQDRVRTSYSLKQIGRIWESVIKDTLCSQLDSSGNLEFELLEVEGLPWWRIKDPEGIRFSKILHDLKQLLRRENDSFPLSHVVLSIGGHHKFFDLQTQTNDHINYLKREIDRNHPKGFWQISQPTYIREDSRVLPHRIPEQRDHWAAARTLMIEHSIFTDYQLDELERLQWTITIPFQGLYPVDELSQAVAITLEALDMILNAKVGIDCATLDNIALIVFGYQILKYIQQKAQSSPVAWIR